MADEKGLQMSMATVDPSVRVFVPAGISFNLAKMRKVTEAVLGRLGCPACHSGFDIRFIHERDFVVNPKTLEVETHLGTQAR